jgi:hypothetical protein
VPPADRVAQPDQLTRGVRRPFVGRHLRAGRGNRTPASSLEDCGSAIELHPQASHGWHQPGIEPSRLLVATSGRFLLIPNQTASPCDYRAGAGAVVVLVGLEPTISWLRTKRALPTAPQDHAAHGVRDSNPLRLAGRYLPDSPRRARATMCLSAHCWVRTSDLRLFRAALDQPSSVGKLCRAAVLPYRAACPVRRGDRPRGRWSGGPSLPAARTSVGDSLPAASRESFTEGRPPAGPGGRCFPRTVSGANRGLRYQPQALSRPGVRRRGAGTPGRPPPATP